MFVRKPFILVFLIILFCFNLTAQESVYKSFRKLSCPEKSWVIFHSFVANKAFRISVHAREKTTEIKLQHLLFGIGNGDQLDAFRHTYWMAMLAKEIGERKSKKLGIAHEKGNYNAFKKGKLEDDILPDKISSEMDLFNNEVGLEISKTSTDFNLVAIVIETIKNGHCKIVKTDIHGNFLDIENNIIPTTELKGKWENKKVLVESNYNH